MSAGPLFALEVMLTGCRRPPQALPNPVCEEAAPTYAAPTLLFRPGFEDGVSVEFVRVDSEWEHRLHGGGQGHSWDTALPCRKDNLNRFTYLVEAPANEQELADVQRGSRPWQDTPPIAGRCS
ncbi:MAG: hypothetical protein AB1938_14410 [Myxococcota bacterium]